MIEVTEKAQAMFSEYMEKNSLASPIRIYLSQGGCCGTSLALALDELKDGDEQFETGGQTYLIEKDLAATVGHVMVDFVEQDGQAGFTVASERAVHTEHSGCASEQSGCGGGCSC
jgi:Fe-S cluster assembly iron-binding protein IscA